MSKLIDRAQKILLAPKSEWPAIADEPETTAGLFKGYIAILAAIGPIASFVEMSVIGVSAPFIGRMRWDVTDGLIAAVVSYGLALLSVWLFSLIVNALAPTFGAQKDPVAALKVTAYSLTAVWVTSVATIVPFLGVLIMILGLVYTIYLLYLGLPVLMKAPQDKVAGYTAVSIVCAIGLSLVSGIIVAMIVGGNMFMGGRWSGPTIVNDGGTVGGPVGRLEDWAKSIEEAGKRVEASEDARGVPSSDAVGQFLGAVTGSNTSVKALSTEEIKAFVPATLGGLPRTSMSSERNGAMGIQVSEANATYDDGQGRSLRLKIKDTGGAQGLVRLAAWAGVEQERSWDSGYERDYKENGRIVHERWDNASGSGEFGVIVGGRFAVEVAGKAGSIDELKRALAEGVDVARLEGMAAAAN